MWSSLDDVEKGRLFVGEAVLNLGSDRVVSHTSAALVHRLPVLRAHLAHLHVIGPSRTSGFRSETLTIHVAKVPPVPMLVDGVRVTTIERTVWDLARSGDADSALIAADHALRSGATTPVLLDAEGRALTGSRGVGRARGLLALASPLSESPGESLTALRLDQLGCDPPQR